MSAIYVFTNYDIGNDNGTKHNDHGATTTTTTTTTNDDDNNNKNDDDDDNNSCTNSNTMEVIYVGYLCMY